MQSGLHDVAVTDLIMLPKLDGLTLIMRDNRSAGAHGLSFADPHLDLIARELTRGRQTAPLSSRQ
ncbi:hypothetical protein [Desulfolithobacter sp.]